MYRVSPFNYFVSAVLSTGLAGAPVHCAANEVLHLEPPSSQTCGQYLTAFAKMSGGAVLNPSARENCGYCAIASTDGFLAQIGANYSERWRNFGLMWVYIVFNIAGAVFFYWLLRVPKKKKGGKDIDKESTKKE
jgi:ATP-binding cassette subfamily G (WHITE) protein 2 (PDR)